MPAGMKVKLNNAALLRWARESSGYGLDEIARSLRKHPETILAWESGEDAPTYPQLRDFAAKVKRPLAALFLPEVPPELPAPVDYRAKSGERAGRYTAETLLAVRMLRNSLSELRALLEGLRQSLVFSMPRWASSTDPVARAREMRSELEITLEAQMGWKTAAQAFEAWRSVLFDRGVLVQVLDMPLEDARGFSVLENDLVLGGIAVSREEGAREARIFSVFHEVAHLCLRSPGVSGLLVEDLGAKPTAVERLEVYCNHFANAFLLPRDHPAVIDAAHSVAQDFTAETALQYAHQFNVSKDVLARTALYLGFITPQTYQAETEQWRAQYRETAANSEKVRGWGSSEAKKKVGRLGKGYVAAVLQAWDRDMLSAYEVSNLLSLGLRHLDEARSLVVGR